MSQATKPLIEVDELHQRLDEPGVRVADVRWYLGRPTAGRDAYAQGHIPGAAFVDLDTDLADPAGFGAPGRHPLPSAASFARRLGQLGFGSDDLIVAYDDASGTIAARLWWMLDSLGHRGGVRVLNGGIQAWTAVGNELSTDEPALPPVAMELAGEWPRVIGRDALAANLGELTLLDVRAPERYRGEVEPVDPQAGHIPGALNAPTAGNLDGAGRLRDEAELRELYDGIRAGGQGTTIVSCGSGVTACHAALAMRLAGLPDPLLYVGSFSDWSRWACLSSPDGIQAASRGAADRKLGRVIGHDDFAHQRSEHVERGPIDAAVRHNGVRLIESGYGADADHAPFRVVRDHDQSSTGFDESTVRVCLKHVRER